MVEHGTLVVPYSSEAVEISLGTGYQSDRSVYDGRGTYRHFGGGTESIPNTRCCVGVSRKYRR